MRKIQIVFLCHRDKCPLSVCVLNPIKQSCSSFKYYTRARARTHTHTHTHTHIQTQTYIYILHIHRFSSSLSLGYAISVGLKNSVKYGQASSREIKLRPFNITIAELPVLYRDSDLQAWNFPVLTKCKYNFVEKIGNQVGTITI